MIHRVTSRNVAALPAATPRVSPTRGQSTPVFSVGKAPSSNSATGTSPLLASVAPGTAAPAPQSQINGGSTNFRQLFSGTVLPVQAPPTPAPAPPFVPAFRAATGTGVGNDGNPVSWN